MDTTTQIQNETTQAYLAMDLLRFSTAGISNWPENFFGDEMGDLVAMAEAAMKRQINTGNHQEVHHQ